MAGAYTTEPLLTGASWKGKEPIPLHMVIGLPVGKEACSSLNTLRGGQRCERRPINPTPTLVWGRCSEGSVSVGCHGVGGWPNLYGLGLASETRTGAFPGQKVDGKWSNWG